MEYFKKCYESLMLFIPLKTSENLWFCAALRRCRVMWKNILLNAFLPSINILNALKTPEPLVFWCFQEVSNVNISQNWLSLFDILVLGAKELKKLKKIHQFLYWYNLLKRIFGDDDNKRELVTSVTTAWLTTMENVKQLRNPPQSHSRSLWWLWKGFIQLRLDFEVIFCQVL